MNMLIELEKGAGFHASGKLQRAERVYRHILEQDSKNKEALNLLGILLRDQGNFIEAESYLLTAVGLDNQRPDFYYNLAEVYRLNSSFDKAILTYSKSIKLNPDFLEARINRSVCYIELGKIAAAESDLRNLQKSFPGNRDVLFNLAKACEKLGNDQDAEKFLKQISPRNLEETLALLELYFKTSEFDKAKDLCGQDYQDDRFYNAKGALLKQLGKLDDAKESFEKSLKLNQENAEAWNNLSLVYKKMGQFDQAVIALKKATQITPEDPSYHFNLAGLFNVLHRKEEALVEYELTLKYDPTNVSAKHMLDALSGRTSSGAPEAYVESLFDVYADNFENDLIINLEYRVPESLAEFTKSLFPERNFREMYDAGCGTGLCADSFCEIVDEIVGVDLSTKMLNKAEEKGLYKKLIAGDVVKEMPTSVDLIVAADVFIYLGALEEFFQKASKSLRSDGLFIFSVEACDESFVIRETGRYAHSKSYISGLSEKFGFQILGLKECPIRKHNGSKIPGFLIALVHS